MGTFLLIFVVCLMITFVILSFIQKSNDSEELPILSLEKVKQFKEELKEEK